MDACAYDCAAEAAPESSGQATCAVRCKLRGHPESPDGTPPFALQTAPKTSRKHTNNVWVALIFERQIEND